MVDITSENIGRFLAKLNFSLKDGEENSYVRIFPKLNNYEIRVSVDEKSFTKSEIDYGEEIKKGNKTTCNFSKQENFVVLDCVCRLLDQGYLPEYIELEKNWKLGHKEKGGLDILIVDQNKHPFLMVECKTWDKEYRKEKYRMLYENGGQIFSYYAQEKETQYVCLYTSMFDGSCITYDNFIVKITDNIRNSNSQKEAYENWKPQIYENRGIFESQVKPYLVKFSGLRRKDLTPLTKEDGGDIFNRFAEILRRNVVSDKTNAYNKIFNLFLCKIVDEYETVDDEKKLRFQWEEGEGNEITMLRLNDLYKKGMKQYLNLDISSVEIEELETQLKSLRSDGDKERIKELFIQQKLYTSNEFAFKEVFDKNTFDINCVVVKEVVNLLEKYRIRYETKQQFLGDFFEKLLNTGIKQEVGQFFTPVPIAQFICKSLPVWEIIEEKNKQEQIYFLPYCIDYSSGAGHFLTEIMGEINYYIDNKITDDFIKNGRARVKYTAYKNNFDWAGEYVYGIEKDYRLAKTTKIATFLNGDGDATIICGDGLDNFYTSKEYRNKLKLGVSKKDNGIFDIVVANPPYSVSGFTTALKNGNESFELFESFTNKSNEIECLFVERTKQLLRIGGVAGIILPTNVIESSGIYTKIREMLLENFEIKAIVKLGKNTFMATKTSTTILFLERIENTKAEIKDYLDKSIKQNKDTTINKIEKPITKYLKATYDISLSDYFSFFTNDDEESDLKKIKPYRAYVEEYKKQTGQKKLSDFVRLKELENLCYFILAYEKKMVIYVINSNGIKDEKKILGYEFSERKGYEGIYVFNMGGQLYNPNNLRDRTKVNSYILQSFNNEEISLDKSIPNLFVAPLHSLIDFTDIHSEKVININTFETAKNNTTASAQKAILKLNLEKVRVAGIELLNEYKKDKKKIYYAPIKSVLKKDIESGGTPPTRTPEFWKDGTVNWLKIGDMKEKYIIDVEEKITMKGLENKKLTIFDEGTVVFSIFASLGKVGILKIKTTLNQAICGLIADEEKILVEYLYYILLIEKNSIIGRKTHRTQDNINQTKLGNYEIPIIKDKKEQLIFVHKMQKIETEIVGGKV